MSTPEFKPMWPQGILLVIPSYLTVVTCCDYYHFIFLCMSKTGGVKKGGSPDHALCYIMDHLMYHLV